MKNLKRLTRAFAVHAMIFSLLQTTFIFNVQAAPGDVTSKDILGIAQIAVNTYGQFLGMKQQTIMQQIQAQKNQQMMQSLSPNCRKPDGTACYTVAGKYFPECPLPASMSNMPQNVCSAATPDPNQIAQMITYESIAKGWVNYFDQMMNEASNSATPFGLKCLQDKQKALDSQLVEMVNNLTRLQDQLNKDKETFRLNNQKIMDQIASMNDELMGSANGKNNLNLKSKIFADYFKTPGCQTIITKDVLDEGPKIGLLGVLQSLAPTNKKAADYRENRSMVESEINRDIEAFQATIANGGLEDFLAGKIVERSKYNSLYAAAEKKKSEFDIAKARIAKGLKELDYEIPPMDKTFSADFDTFMASSQNFFKNQYINDCMTGADKTGIALTTTQVLDSLQQLSTNNAGTARNSYRLALKNILDSDNSFDVKLKMIESLEKEGKYQDISVVYKNSSAQTVIETPYDLYMKTISKCEQRFAQDDQHSLTSAKGVSHKKKVERGQALLRELKSLHDNYASDMGNRMREQALSCNGEGKKAGSSCGDDKSLNYTEASFCMNHADQCANQIAACYAEANNHVETRKKEMNRLATVFNNNAQAVIANSNRLYEMQKAAVMDMIKVVQARFPGTNFPIPEGMTILPPKNKSDTFGIELANDGNLSFLDDLPKKIELLKKVFNDQKAKVNDEISDYIAKQTQAMSKEKDRWQQLAGECKGSIDTSSRELAKMNQEGMKKQAELDQKTMSFCNKYSSMRENPLAACDDAKKLAEDADKIQARLTNDALNFTGKFKNLCNSVNNERNDDLASCRDPDAFKDMSSAQKADCNRRLAKAGMSAPEAPRASRLNYNTFCKKSDGINSDKEFLDAAIKKLSTSDQEALKDISTMKDLDKKIESLSDNSYNFFNNINALLSGDKPVCEQLQSINDLKSDYAGKTEKEVRDQIAAKKSENEKAKAAEEKRIDPKDANANVALKALDAKYKLLDEELKKESENALKKVSMIDAFNSLKPAQSKEDVVTAQFERLGEQSDMSCDAQASNNNMPKGLGNSLLPSGFDSAILGTTK